LILGILTAYGIDSIKSSNLFRISDFFHRLDENAKINDKESTGADRLFYLKTN